MIEQNEKLDFTDTAKYAKKAEFEGYITGIEMYHRPHQKANYYSDSKSAGIVIWFIVENENQFNRAWFKTIYTDPCIPTKDEFKDLSLWMDEFLGKRAKVIAKTKYDSYGIRMKPFSFIEKVYDLTEIEEVE